MLLRHKELTMSQYKVRNWSQYNESLKKRGSLTLWIEESAIQKWKALKKSHSVGAPQKYSNDAILCMMTVKAVYHLPYRQLAGFLASIFVLMGIELPVPHFTTIAERARSLMPFFKKLSKKLPKDLVFDSSGFKIYGEGEWHARKHGKSKRRRWKKFHIAVCPKTHEIIVAEATELETADCEIGPKLLKKSPHSVKRVIGDGAYDTFENYKSAHERNVRLLVPPRSGAVCSQSKDPWKIPRDRAISEIIGLGNDDEGIKLWKTFTGYHKRSLVETAFSRYKGIFGSKLSSKTSDNQRVELFLKAYVLNKMTNIGMPKGEMV